MYKIKVIKEKAKVNILTDEGKRVATLKSGSTMQVPDTVVQSCSKNLLGLLQLKVITVNKIIEGNIKQDLPKTIAPKKTKGRKRIGSTK